MGTGIDGSTPAEVDPGFGSGGSLYRMDGTLRPGGAMAAGQGAAHALKAARGRGVDAAWPSSPAAAAITSPSAGAGVVAGGAAMVGEARPEGADGRRRCERRAPLAVEGAGGGRRRR